MLTTPDPATRLLHRLCRRSAGHRSPSHHIDLEILLAEAHLRRRDVIAAAEAAACAVRDAETLDPTEIRRRLCAYGVSADITLYTGHAATAACDTYLHQLTPTGDWAADTWRTLHARTALAVATYHEINGERGRQQLADLHRQAYYQYGPGHPSTVTLTNGLAAIHDNCSARHPHARELQIDAGTPAPFPGAILHPDLSQPDPAHLATRIHTRPGRCCWPPGRRR